MWQTLDSYDVKGVWVGPRDPRSPVPRSVGEEVLLRAGRTVQSCVEHSLESKRPGDGPWVGTGRGDGTGRPSLDGPRPSTRRNHPRVLRQGSGSGCVSTETYVPTDPGEETASLGSRDLKYFFSPQKSDDKKNRSGIVFNHPFGLPIPKSIKSS